MIIKVIRRLDRAEPGRAEGVIPMGGVVDWPR